MIIAHAPSGNILANLIVRQASSIPASAAAVIGAGIVGALAPDFDIIDQPYALFTVPARLKPWWLSFILHWSFAAELAIWIGALHIYRQRANHSLQHTALTGRP